MQSLERIPTRQRASKHGDPGMNTNWIGVAFVSEEVPNREQVEDQLAERTEALRQEAQTALDAWLNEQGLEQVMGVIIPKKTI